MPLKKSARSTTSTRSKKSVESKTSTDFTRRIGAGAIFLVVVCGIAAAMLVAARESHQPAEDVQPQTVAPQAQATTPAMTAVPAKTLAAGVTPANTPEEKSRVARPVRRSAPVTLAGCLERADETFRLTDTMGADAPKSRNWKSGFLKKSQASIELVGAANRLKLTDHVGKRVSVTGTLVDGQMRVRSLRRVATSCK